MAFKKKDFIEIEFVGKVKDGEIFDSNIKEILEKEHLHQNTQPKPFILSLGEGMFLNGVEDFLEGKEIGRYEIELEPEKAFGNRESKLIKLVPLRVFKEQNLQPIPGVLFNFDGQVGKVLSVSGGRITVDFNNPVAGKTVVYEVNVLRKLEDINEKAKAFLEFIFRKEIEFEIKGKKLILKVDEKFKKFSELFKDKIKDMLDLDLVVEEKKEEKKEANLQENIEKKSQ
ncbi:MAG: peptidylprolyl isomerase [Candidatus Pacearchaeota archaeon]